MSLQSKDRDSVRKDSPAPTANDWNQADQCRHWNTLKMQDLLFHDAFFCRTTVTQNALVLSIDCFDGTYAFSEPRQMRQSWAYK